MEDADFRSGAITIQWLEQRLPALLAVKPPADGARIAAIAAALVADHDRGPRARAGQAEGATRQADASGREWRRAALRDGLRS